jgi:hypothetical protein
MRWRWIWCPFIGSGTGWRVVLRRQSNASECFIMAFKFLVSRRASVRRVCWFVEEDEVASLGFLAWRARRSESLSRWRGPESMAAGAT